MYKKCISVPVDHKIGDHHQLGCFCYHPVDPFHFSAIPLRLSSDMSCSVLWECSLLCHLLSFLFVLTYLLLKFVFSVPHRSEFTRYFSFLNGSSRHWEIQGEFCCSVAQLCLTPCDPLDCSLHNVDWLRKPHQKKKKGKKTLSRSCNLRGVSSQQEREFSPLTLLSHPGSCVSSAGVSSTHDSEHLLTD